MEKNIIINRKKLAQYLLDNAGPLADFAHIDIDVSKNTHNEFAVTVNIELSAIPLDAVTVSTKQARKYIINKDAC